MISPSTRRHSTASLDPQISQVWVDSYSASRAIRHVTRAHLHTLAEENGERPSLTSDVDHFNVRIDRLGQTLNERAPSGRECGQAIEQSVVAHGRKATDGLTRHSAQPLSPNPYRLVRSSRPRPRRGR